MSHLTWDQYFMGVAVLSGMRSKDENTKVGACIVNQDKKIVGIGYNGMPKGLDEYFPWTRNGENKNETKYPYVVHAEQNAILNSTRELKGCSIYVTLFPCSNCSKAIVQAGIGEVVYSLDKYDGSDDNLASKYILDQCGIKVRKIKEMVVSVDG